MADPTSNPGPTAAPPGMPLWVKIFGAVLIIMVLIVGIVLAGVEHGPGLHNPSGNHNNSTHQP
jgi:hypothetical protein